MNLDSHEISIPDHGNFEGNTPKSTKNYEDPLQLACVDLEPTITNVEKVVEVNTGSELLSKGIIGNGNTFEEGELARVEDSPFLGEGNDELALWSKGNVVDDDMFMVDDCP
ncbi:hypothetical protein IEQ34_021869 [Dendrobium chrysotoxum]|uniref:Uncharacterized protein n=1 Tax=Dendrobium chrysotoxum TaxID=161865 RepID=A0AAV7FXD2_DENCH|nr:hypothetical protein IEQ34_021869 [Dendrobium chrysotoxum]